MMVSTKGRYALRVMIDLAEHNQGQYIPSRDIAGRQMISEKYLESILATLTRAGLLQGVRGKGGGYRLTRPPETYSVGEIVRAAEDSIAPVSCLERGASCSNAGECRMLPVWQGLDAVVNEYLDSVPLISLVREEPAEEV
ncbi:MAG: Rrf2 family transcriptional regulator [Oscillospiraceae bacterium]|nr:Rrf2 family transcriptional regulator [Oscillospiraceae bacterium]